MSQSQREQDTLPPPVSLTLKEAMEVAGGSSPIQAAAASVNFSLAHSYLVKGLPPEYWGVLGQNVGGGV